VHSPPTRDDEDRVRLSAVLEFVGRRWIGAILLGLGHGATRFGEIQRQAPGLSARMLTVRLRELEAAGLVERAVEPAMPVTVRYRLTQQGEDLLRSLQGLADYGRRWGLPAG
jgi:Predicted transcriptional regulators